MFCSRDRNLHSEFRDFFQDFPEILDKYDKLLKEETINKIHSNSRLSDAEKHEKMENFKRKEEEVLKNRQKKLKRQEKEKEKQSDKNQTSLFSINPGNFEDLRETELNFELDAFLEDFYQQKQLSPEQGMPFDRYIEFSAIRSALEYGFDRPFENSNSSFNHFAGDLLMKARMRILSIVFPNIKFFYSSSSEIGEAEDKIAKFINFFSKENNQNLKLDFANDAFFLVSHDSDFKTWGLFFF